MSKIRDGHRVLDTEGLKAARRIAATMEASSNESDRGAGYWMGDLLVTLDALRERCEGLEYAKNLLAICHSDGGHYTEAHGIRKATDDAIVKHGELRRSLDHAESTAARRLDLLREVQGRWMSGCPDEPNSLAKRIDAEIGGGE